MFSITITPPGSSQAFVLYTNAWSNAYIADHKEALETEEQLDPLYASNSPYLKYRGNDQYPESFQIWRNVDDNGNLFADAYAARAWYQSHLANVPREGQVDFIFPAHHTRFGYATLRSRLEKQTGVLLRINYTLRATQITIVS